MIIRLGVWLIVLSIFLFVLTTLGLVNTFQDVSTLSGSEKSSALAKGISINMWYTIFGSIVGLTGSMVLVIGLVLRYKAKRDLESELRSVARSLENFEE